MTTNAELVARARSDTLTSWQAARLLPLLADRLEKVAADSEHLANTGYHWKACPGYYPGGDCDCSWGVALRHHREVMGNV